MQYISFACSQPKKTRFFLEDLFFIGVFVVSCFKMLARFGMVAGLTGLSYLAFEKNQVADVSAAASPLHVGAPGTATERTFIAVKPDGVQRGLVGEVIGRFEKRGYKLVAMKLIHPSEAKAREHYADLSARSFFPGLVKYFSSGPVVAMVWEGPNVIKGGRLLVGATNPNDSLPGSIRGDLCLTVGRNIVHGSDGPDSAADEISLWFKPEEICPHDRVIEKWIYE